ncbi:ATP-binding protein [Neisseriaceae bacterium TC5R-5]|nr:ATP-binding protein [Neisseriaceae bacterium TC5R-5]
MLILNRPISVIVWLLLSLVGGFWLSWHQFNQLYDRFYQDTSIALRVLSQKTTQHDTVLAMLGVMRVEQNPSALLLSLQESLPQLLAIGYWQQQNWQGSQAGLSPPSGLWQQAIKQRHAVVKFAGAQHYWLQSPNGWALLINTQALFQSADWPASLANVQLELNGQTIPLLSRQTAPPPLGWHLQLSKSLASPTQALTLNSQKTLTSKQLPWQYILLWSGLLAALIASIDSVQQTRVAQRREGERKRLSALERLSTLGEMAAGLAHELNQPLTAILANTGAALRLLDDVEERDSVRQALRTSSQQAKRAAAIIARLRQLVEQNHAGNRQAINPDSVLRMLLFLRQAELAQQNICVQWQNQSPGYAPWAEWVALEQILHNLVQNACDAIQSQGIGGVIQLRGQCEGEYYRFTVLDNGPGLAAEVLPRVFEPFFSTRAKGMGLGLSLCETLAHSLNGSLTIENVAGGGAMATLTLPLARSCR